ncbi:MAG: hypothetical protein Fur0043_02610 [Anaerolineales bacterium]
MTTPTVTQSNTSVPNRETTIRESEAFFRSVFEQSADALLLLENGVFTYCNQATVTMMGAKDKEQFLSVHPSKLSPERQPDGRLSSEKADEMIRIALERGSHRFNWIHRRLDGSDFPVEVLLTPITMNGRQVIHTVWRDISERMKVEDALRESEARYAAVVTQAKDGIVIIQDNLLKFVNQAMADMLGYTQAEMENTPVIDYIAPESKALVIERIKARLAGQEVPTTYEARLQRKDGTAIDAELSAGVIEYLGKPADVGVIRDITERKKFEQQIQAVMERRGYQVRVSTEISQEIARSAALDELFERVVTLTKERLGYYHTQLLRYDPTQEAVVLIAGYGEIGARMLEMGHRMEMGRGLIGTAAASGQTMMRPVLADDPDWQPNPLLPETKGEIAVPIKLGDQVLGVLDVQSDRAGDITEDDRLLLEGLCGQIAVAIEQTRLRQEMEERLEELNRLYRAMIQEGWQSFQETLDIATGFMFDQGIIRPVKEISLAEELFAPVPIALPGGQVLGKLAVAQDAQRPLTADDQIFLEQVAEQVALALDSARLYQELAATVTQLRELDRLKSSFLANMSHELRTPLNSILGFADVMLEGLDGPLTENMNNDLQLIQKNGQHLLHLINDVLDMAKIEAGRMNLSPETFRFHEILEEVTSITSPLASEKSLSLFIENDSDQEVEIFADRTRIRQVMLNLVNNAMKFTEKGKISMRTTRTEDGILVTVRDTGIGIPPDKLEAIFQEFTQVDSSSTRKAGGTGLGLPISRKLVEMHGGRLWVESSGIPGEGSTFYVELPLETHFEDAIEKQEK